MVYNVYNMHSLLNWLFFYSLPFFLGLVVYIGSGMGLGYIRFYFCHLYRKSFYTLNHSYELYMRWDTSPRKTYTQTNHREVDVYVCVLPSIENERVYWCSQLEWNSSSIQQIARIYVSHCNIYKNIYYIPFCLSVLNRELSGMPTHKAAHKST